MSNKKPSFSLGFQSNSGVNVQGEELVLCKIFCCESGALIAGARYGLVSLSVQIWKPFVWLKAPSELRGFTLPVVTWLVRGCTQTIASCMDRTARGRGQVRQSSQSHESQLFLLRSTSSSSRRRIEMKFFIATLSTVQVGAFLFSTCKRQARRTPSTPAIRCGGQALVESTTNKRPALFVSSYFDANPRGLKLNCTLWASKSTWTWLQLFSQTARVFLSDPSKRRAVVRRSCATGDMAIGRPRA